MSKDLTIQFLDVGQGDGIYIEFPSKSASALGATMLVDLGSTKGKGTVAPDIQKYFRTFTRFQKPGQTLDYLILTHGDRDHYNMVTEFLTTFRAKVGNLMYGGLIEDYNIRPLLEQLTKEGGANKLQFSTFPDRIEDDFGGVIVWCLACSCTGPNKNRNGWNKNSDSIVLQLAYEGVKVMLTGDATTDTEQYILGNMGTKASSTFSLKSDVLKVGHHGSARTSSSKGWIEGVKPEFIFISSDRHGTLDEDEQKTRATGHRLPQELTLDIIRKATKLYDKCASHTYVSSYAPSDYVEYAKTDRDLQDRHLIQENPRDKKQIGWPRGWYQLPTTEAIFTTLVTVGGNGDEEDGDEADQGCQYQLRISSGGGIEVTSTVDFFSTTTPLTPKK